MKKLYVILAAVFMWVSVDAQSIYKSWHYTIEDTSCNLVVDEDCCNTIELTRKNNVLVSLCDDEVFYKVNEWCTQCNDFYYEVLYCEDGVEIGINDDIIYIYDKGIILTYWLVKKEVSKRCVK